MKIATVEISLTEWEEYQHLKRQEEVTRMNQTGVQKPIPQPFTFHLSARTITHECWTCAYGLSRRPESLTMARALYHIEHDHDVRPVRP